LAELMKNQDAEAEEALGLLTQGLIEINQWTDDGPAYVSLTHKGQSCASVALPGLVNQLAADSGRPQVLHGLVHRERLPLDHLADAQESGLVEATTRDGVKQVRLRRFWSDDCDLGLMDVAVKLTRRGQEYLAR
jgi:hypothetical protein